MHPYDDTCLWRWLPTTMVSYDDGCLWRWLPMTMVAYDDGFLWRWLPMTMVAYIWRYLPMTMVAYDDGCLLRELPMRILAYDDGHPKCPRPCLLDDSTPSRAHTHHAAALSPRAALQAWWAECTRLIIILWSSKTQKVKESTRFS